jgi:Big-like domain-containing protein
MFSPRRNAALAALLPLLVLAACVPGDVTRPPGGQASLIVHVDVAATAVATVVVEVSAPDIPTPLVFNIPITGGVASGTITIPAGSNRTIAIRAFDATGVETHSGSTTISVQPGINTGISITLAPLTGELPIVATLGSFRVTVGPTANTLGVAAAETVQLTGTVLDAQSQPVSGATVTWATHNPGIASVSATGLVSAVGVGQTDISATFHGAIGSAAITVVP